MKKSFFGITLVFLIFSMALMSCGTGKKLTASETRVSDLERELAIVQREVREYSMQVEGLRKEKAVIQNDLKALTTESKLTISDQAKRLRTFQDKVNSQNAVMSKLKTAIADALGSYKADELSVYTKDGKVYVSLEEKLLFKSGSDVVDAKGVEALKTLAKVLNNNEDVAILVEGHTDNVPIKSKLYKDNWDLSTARATAVLRILTKDIDFDSNRLTAAGKGEFSPIATNNTVEGRASNRRTEVILTPDLTELYLVLEE
ncbi:OmpA family protein [Alkaliflexus imshenetskii]|uniref:OmpA family protein n=1 Tax=Alkaliflexus imshenetskii TaxID=286730 RepID=UPI0004BC6728|nr:OmpA family protein [Alkaliflexus imshenetskii]